MMSSRITRTFMSFLFYLLSPSFGSLLHANSSPWASEVGEARSVRSKTDDIAERLRERFPLSPVTQAAIQLDQSAYQLLKSIECGERIESIWSLIDTFSTETHFVQNMAKQDCQVRGDRRVIGYFPVLCKRLDHLVHELEESVIKNRNCSVHTNSVGPKTLYIPTVPIQHAPQLGVPVIPSSVTLTPHEFSNLNRKANEQTSALVHPSTMWKNPWNSVSSLSDASRGNAQIHHEEAKSTSVPRPASTTQGFLALPPEKLSSHRVLPRHSSSRPSLGQSILRAVLGEVLGRD